MNHMLTASLLMALAQGAEVESGSREVDPAAGMELVSDGDRSWYAGERGDAAAAYRQAVDQGGLAAEAMARLRLLHMEGSLAGLFHGPRIDEALAACPEEEPWCRLAWADYHLFAPEEVGARREQAVAWARSALIALPGPATARLVLAGERPAEDLAEPDIPLDGLADGVLAADGALPWSPGTWVLGLGFMGAPGLGFGAAVRFVHPDLAWAAHRLTMEAGATTRGSAWASSSLRTSGRVALAAQAAGWRTVFDLWDGDARDMLVAEGAHVALGPALQLSPWSLELGALARWDAIQAPAGPRQAALAGHGLQARVSWDRRRGHGAARRGDLVSISAITTLALAGADYHHLLVRGDLRKYQPLPDPWLLAGRVVAERAFHEDIPPNRLPSAGGADILRGAPAGRYRGPTLAAADLELRRMIGGPLEGVLFAAGAWVEGTGAHPAGGLGVRLLLPPREWNVVRLDLAVSDAGFAVSTGWGEVF